MKNQDYTEKVLNYNSLDKLKIYYVGKRVKSKNHFINAQIKNHFLFVFVNEGSAQLYGEKQTDFSTGDLVVVFPHRAWSYKANTEWSISWVGVYGEDIEPMLNDVGITRDNPVFHVKNAGSVEAIFQSIYSLTDDRSPSSQMVATSKIYELFAVLLEHSKGGASIIDSAVHMIDHNYTNPAMNVAYVCNSLFISRAYFSRLFQKEKRISPQKYIALKRINCAKQLLKDTDSTISEVAVNCGFKDPLYFSRFFRENVGASPTEYRRNPDGR